MEQVRVKLELNSSHGGVADRAWQRSGAPADKVSLRAQAEVKEWSR